MSNQIQNSKFKRVLVFSIAYFPHIGGAEVAIKEITDRIGDFSWDMVTLNIDTKENGEIEKLEIKKLRDVNVVNAKFERVGNVNVYRIDCAKILFPFYACKKGIELHRLNNYQIVWGMMANLAGLGALFFTKFHKFTPRHGSGRATGHKPKFLLTLQTGNDDRKVWKKTWWWRPLYKMIYRKADYIQAISNYLAERGKRFGAKCRIEIVPNGVSFGKIQDTSNHRWSHRRSGTSPAVCGTSGAGNIQINSKIQIPNVKPDDKVIVTTSRLVEKNGLADLIRAIQLSIINYSSATSSGPSGQLSIKLLIAGTGELEYELKTLVRELKLEDRVIFLGQVAHDELAELYKRADVFARPSLSEGLGISFLEAMGAGVPVIATPVGGIPDFLEDTKTGWFCEVKNPKSIAEKINYILDKKNENKVRQVVEKARKLVEEKYNWDKIAVDMEKIFKEF